MVQIVRVYTGSDGESHFEDLTPDQFGEIASNLGTGPINLMRFSPPHFSDYHNAPRRHYVVSMSGIAEFEVGDGTVRRLYPGDVMVAEDLTGHGHTTRAVGDAPRISLHIPLADA